MPHSIRDGPPTDEAEPIGQIAARILQNLEKNHDRQDGPTTAKAAFIGAIRDLSSPRENKRNTLYVPIPSSRAGAAARQQPAAPARARRTTRELSLRQVRSLFDALAYAEARGWKLTRFIAIQLEHAPEAVQKALGGILEKLRHWLSYHGAGVAYLWTLERSGQHGFHAHLLVHVPPALTRGFTRELHRVVRAALRERRLPKGAVDSQPTYAVTGALKYMAKGCSRAAAAKYAIKRSNEGHVPGKRCGFSESIGPTAQARHLLRAKTQ